MVPPRPGPPGSRAAPVRLGARGHSCSRARHGRTSTAHSAPKIRNGPNGTYVRRPIRRVASRTTSTTPAASSPASTAAERRARPPSISPTPTSSFTSPMPERAGPERDRQQVQHGRDRRSRPAIAGSTAVADERVLPGDVEQQRDRDDRQRQHVGQQPLVEVRREPDDERRRTTARTAPSDERGRRRTGVGSSANANAPIAARRRPSASRSAGRPGAPRRAPASGPRAGRRRRPNTGPRPEPTSDERRSTVGAVGRRSVSRPRAGQGQLDERRVRSRRSRRAARTASPCGSSRCRAMSRWTHGSVRELAQEDAALDERPLGRARVLDVAVPALHLGAVLVDERDLPVALAGPVGRAP